MNDAGPSNSPAPSRGSGATDEQLSAELRKWTGATPALHPVGELLDRHWEAGFAYARLCTDGPRTAGILTTAAFTRLFGETLRQSGPTSAWRPHLLVTVRRIAAEWAGDHRRDMLHPDLRTEGAVRPAARLLPPPHRRLLSGAFPRLPQSARCLLWHVEVEAEPPATPAGLLGLDEEGARVELERARDRLREECLQLHRELAPDEECRRYLRLLDVTYRRGGRDIDPDLRAHIGSCGHCGGAADQLDHFNHGLGAALAEAVLGWGGRQYAEGRLNGTTQLWTESGTPTGAAAAGTPAAPAPGLFTTPYEPTPEVAPGPAGPVGPAGEAFPDPVALAGAIGESFTDPATPRGGTGGSSTAPVAPRSGSASARAAATGAEAVRGAAGPDPAQAPAATAPVGGPPPGTAAAAPVGTVPGPAAAAPVGTAPGPRVAGSRAAARRSAHKAARRAARRRHLTAGVLTVSGLVVLPLVLWSLANPGDDGPPGAGRGAGETPGPGPGERTRDPSWAGAGDAEKGALRGRLHNVGSGLCVGVDGGKAVQGAEAELAPCSAASAQQWTYETDGLLRSGAAPKLCLDSRLGYSVRLAPCAGAAQPDTRNVRYDFTLQGALVPRSDQDLALAPAATDGSGSLVLKTRAEQDVQRWVIDTAKADLRMEAVTWDAALPSARPTPTPAARPAPSRTATPAPAPPATPATSGPAPDSPTASGAPPCHRYGHSCDEDSRYGSPGHGYPGYGYGEYGYGEYGHGGYGYGYGYGGHGDGRR
ncbi:ricin-type beta-trefoil lectin domain protein [Streptomyces sp. NPDC086081]|uniref:ricin-type beta-trefoil lectin domain protein n=1 Tax=Streptomyces sp. NPDC086081 TaxID=3365749 RepID=UPI00380220B5